MSWIKAIDPLALLAIQTGKVGTPSEQVGAVAATNLDVEQRSFTIGEPVPIVFARLRNGSGGILVSPGATEARFENNTSNATTAFYHLVVSEGRIGDIPVKDIFQRACRVGTHTQTYSRRAGAWLPGNFIVQREGYQLPEASSYCGSLGLYPDMSTVSFQTGEIPDGFDQWNRQVHIFIRNGMEVQRLVDNTLGPSDNFADLVLWMLKKSRRVPDALIDVDMLTSAAQFLEFNEFTCNCYITEARNYSDLLSEWAPYFLLCESSTGGKKGLRPLLPVTATGAINTSAIAWKYIFTEQTILPGTLEINYTSLSDRLPFVAQVIWRQQPEMEPGIIRTSEVRYEGTAELGPYESHDLSAFCTNEDHAVKAGAYILSKRVRVTHTIRFSAKPEQHSQILTPGDIIRVKLQRLTSNAESSTHDYLYQVERITKTLAGDVGYECSYFPVDSSGQSLIALDVANATGSGVILTTNKTGVSCDTNSSSDDTIPDESYIVPVPEFDFPDGTFDPSGVFDPSGTFDPGNNFLPDFNFDENYTFDPGDFDWVIVDPSGDNQFTWVDADPEFDIPGFDDALDGSFDGSIDLGGGFDIGNPGDFDIDAPDLDIENPTDGLEGGGDVETWPGEPSVETNSSGQILLRPPSSPCVNQNPVFGWLARDPDTGEETIYITNVADPGFPVPPEFKGKLLSAIIECDDKKRRTEEIGPMFDPSQYSYWRWNNGSESFRWHPVPGNTPKTQVTNGPLRTWGGLGLTYTAPSTGGAFGTFSTLTLYTGSLPTDIIAGVTGNLGPNETSASIGGYFEFSNDRINVSETWGGITYE